MAIAMPYDLRKMAGAVIHSCVNGEAGLGGFITYKLWNVNRGLERAAYFEVHTVWLPPVNFGLKIDWPASDYCH